jgi:hypothetical protein
MPATCSPFRPGDLPGDLVPGVDELADDGGTDEPAAPTTKTRMINSLENGQVRTAAREAEAERAPVLQPPDGQGEQPSPHRGDPAGAGPAEVLEPLRARPGWPFLSSRTNRGDSCRASAACGPAGRFGA